MKSIHDLFDLSGKNILITGGAGYLGSAICETLAELKGNIVIASRNLDSSQGFARNLTKRFGIKTLALQGDITSPEQMRKVLLKMMQEFNSLDILINNAWSGRKNTFESISYEDWQYDIDVCLNGVFNTVKEAHTYLKDSQGVVLNIASMYGHVAPDYRLYDGKKYANPPSYGAAKAGVIQLTKYLASFLSPDQIRVNALSPGPFPFESTHKENPQFIERLSAKTVLGRVGFPEDLKGAIALLCSDASQYITGQNICVDGGWAIW